jgi:hypothetical protein
MQLALEVDRTYGDQGPFNSIHCPSVMGQNTATSKIRLVSGEPFSTAIFDSAIIRLVNDLALIAFPFLGAPLLFAPQRDDTPQPSVVNYLFCIDDELNYQVNTYHAGQGLYPYTSKGSELFKRGLPSPFCQSLIPSDFLLVTKLALLNTLTCILA